MSEGSILTESPPTNLLKDCTPASTGITPATARDVMTTRDAMTTRDVMTSRDVMTTRDVMTARDVTKIRDLPGQCNDYTIACSMDTAELWHQHKSNMNFAQYSDEDFLLFLLYQTVRSLSSNFSDTLTLPPKLGRTKLSTSLHTPSHTTVKQVHLINTEIGSRNSSEQENGLNQSYECTKCKKTFRNKYYLSRHEKRSCGKVNPLKVYHCQHCSAVVSSMASLGAHMKQRHRDIRYSCDQCNKTFKNAEYVKQHVRVAHKKIKDHKCVECGKEFTQHGSLQLHIRMVHQKLRNYLCRLCQQRFGCKSHLTRHMRKQHQDAKEHACEICNTVFEQEADLQAHVKQLHYQTEFICNVCDKPFKLKHTLAKHIAKCHGKQNETNYVNLQEYVSSSSNTFT